MSDDGQAEIQGEHTAELLAAAWTSLVHEPYGRVHKGAFHLDGRPVRVTCDHNDGTTPPCGDCFNPATWFTPGWKAACEEHVEWLIREVAMDKEGTKEDE